MAVSANPPRQRIKKIQPVERFQQKHRLSQYACFVYSQGGAVSVDPVLAWTAPQSTAKLIHPALKKAHSFPPPHQNESDFQGLLYNFKLHAL